MLLKIYISKGNKFHTCKFNTNETRTSLYTFYLVGTRIGLLTCGPFYDHCKQFSVVHQVWK